MMADIRDSVLSGEEAKEKVSTRISPRKPATSSHRGSTPTLSDVSHDTQNDDFDDGNDEGDESGFEVATQRRRKRRKVSHVRVDGPVYPRSAYIGWTPPIPPVSEREALRDLAEVFEEERLKNQEEERPEYITLQLEDFSVYTRRPQKFLELTSLDTLQNRNGYSELLFDGVVSCGRERRYLQGVTFSTMAIEEYGDMETTDMAGRIYIQSPEAHQVNTWYALGQPSLEYARFHRPFLWLATFTTHVINFLIDHSDSGEAVTLQHFRSDFSKWLHKHYRNDASFTRWHNECGQLSDFRTNVAAHVGYLWKECFSIDDREIKLCKHPFWTAIDPCRLLAVPEQASVETKTIVTPFVYQCFRRMYFSEMMEKRGILDPSIMNAIQQRKRNFGLTPFDTLDVYERAPLTPKSLSSTSESPTGLFERGDVVQILPDEGTTWKSELPVWYAYVQDVRSNPKPQMQHELLLDVLWLYEPYQTTMAGAWYPFKNELFFSDNCNCGKSAIESSRVVGKVPVKLILQDRGYKVSAKDLEPGSSLFVRQKFRTVFEDDFYDFQALKESDLKCICSRDKPTAFDCCRAQYVVGDTVLFRERSREFGQEMLEPAQLISFDHEKRRVVLRRLTKRSFEDALAAPNELRLSEEMIYTSPSKIIRKCHVRFYCNEDVQQGLPAPYSHNGAGDYFFVNRDTTLEEDELEETPPIDFPLLNEGWDPTVSRVKPLTGLGMFCGGGNYDRGLEEGGAVKFRYGIDWNKAAIHSYNANAESGVHLYNGSVNDYLAKAMRPLKPAKVRVAQVSDGIDVISAGSPCPGFSNMQVNKRSPESLRNASMVASVVSYVDFYCPKYLILENVITMTAPLAGQKDLSVFGQILASLVSMGYQCQQFNLGAWTCGSSQKRQRVFIAASVPGSEPLPTPAYSHDNPPGLSSRALGRSTHGLRFGSRRNDFTPFLHRSPAEDTKDLPTLGDAQVHICPAFPDHRVHAEPSALTRTILASIPTAPTSMSIARAADAGLLSGPVLEKFNSYKKDKQHLNSRAFQRVDKNELFPTVLTSLPAECYRSGKVVHWEQHRVLSIMEYRRAQGFLDHEVIVGLPSQQIKTIGNSVDRKVSLTLGLSLRASLEQSRFGDDDNYDDESCAEEIYDSEAHIAPPITPPNDGERYSACPATIGISRTSPQVVIQLSPEQKKQIRRDPRNAFKTIMDDFQLGLD